MLFHKKFIIFLALFITLSAQQQLVIVCVIDQCSYDIFKSLPFNHGFKTARNHGLWYNNHFYPYGLATTGPGHTTISTGVLPCVHGIVSNNWINENNQEVHADHLVDSTIKSPLNIKAETLSDVFLKEDPEHHAAAAFSIKPRASVAMAGRQGQAYWFDVHTGNFATSSFYQEAIPAWLQQVNNHHNIAARSTLTWSLFYKDPYHPAYKRADHDYRFTQVPSMIKTMKIEPIAGKKGAFELFARAPQSNKILFDAAQAYLQQPDIKNKDKIIVWLGLSSLDKIGHAYGPHSLEYIDTLYHIDWYLQQFMQTVAKEYDPLATTLIITSDHGCMPIVETLNPRAHPQRYHIDPMVLKNNLNLLIKEKYALENAIVGLDLPNIWLDHTLEHEQKESIITTLVPELKKLPYIVDAWSFKDLLYRNWCHHSYAQLFKNQCMIDRSGDIIVQIKPYCYSSSKMGTAHSSPYRYDRQVPCLVYNPAYQPMILEQKTTALNIAPTIAHILGTTKPPHAHAHPLPFVPH